MLLISASKSWWNVCSFISRAGAIVRHASVRLQRARAVGHHQTAAKIPHLSLASMCEFPMSSDWVRYEANQSLHSRNYFIEFGL